MKKILSPDELRKEVENKDWIMSYNELIAIHDKKNNLVMLIEDFGPKNGFFIEGWRVYHFPRTSSLVEKSYREGTKSIFIIKPGKTELNLVPAFAPIGIESCLVEEDEIKITYAGYGGGGVSASYSRGLAKGVKQIEIHNNGGGSKFGKGTIVLPKYEFLLVGVDDTDTPDEGATYSLVHNIASNIESKFEDVRYMTHNSIQLYPENPHKTKNCFSTVVGFLHNGNGGKIVNEFMNQLKQKTLSNQTVACVYNGIKISQQLFEYSKKAKTSFIDDLQFVESVAKNSGVFVYEITGRRGMIGALASIGLYDQPEYGVQLPG